MIHRRMSQLLYNPMKFVSISHVIEQSLHWKQKLNDSILCETVVSIVVAVGHLSLCYAFSMFH